MLFRIIISFAFFLQLAGCAEYTATETVSCPPSYQTKVTADGSFYGISFSGRHPKRYAEDDARKNAFEQCPDDTSDDSTVAILTDADLPDSSSGETEVSENIDRIDQDIRDLEDNDATDITNDVEDTFDDLDEIDCSISENFSLPECY
tara:strand:- start:504 stop:947 length:444 start_codon:yes stop_codon:yes gene_type:complete